MPVAIAIAAALLAAGPADAERQIRAARAESNLAIAAHDMAGMRRSFAPGYTILPGSLGKPLDAEQLAARILPTFQDPTFIAYVRTPHRVEIATSGKRAAESGRWVGSWAEMDGEMRLSGTYLATWIPTPAGWRLLNESFVTLACTGSSACPKVE
jgi:ketosteroid isomerase-like protein